MSTPLAKRLNTERLQRLGILEEPSGYVDGGNLYEYVGSYPLGRTDPQGLSFKWVERQVQWHTQEAGLAVPFPHVVAKQYITRDSVGFTAPWVYVRADVDTCFFDTWWRLRNITVEFAIDVFRLSDKALANRPGGAIPPDWVIRMENEHISDYNAWNEAAKTTFGLQLVKEAEGKVFGSETEAQEYLLELQSKLLVSLRAAQDQSIQKRDISGNHTFKP